MFCGNCGKEVEDGAMFCPECGAAIVEHTDLMPKHERKRTKKMLGIGIVIIAAIVIAVGAMKIYSYMQSIPSSEEIQTAVNNVQNNAIVTTDGTWLYYNDNGLCKVKLKDGTKQTVISSDIYAEHMFYLGNKLYYFTFPGYFVLEGKKGKDLGFSVFTEGCIQSDGSKFYVIGSANYEDGGVYSCKVGNTKKGTKLSDIHPARLLLQGKYLYVVSDFDSVNDLPNEDYGTWRMNKNGKNLIYVFKYCPDYIVFSDDKMYYTNENRAICSANLDGSNEIVFEDAIVSGGLNVSDQYIFYISSESQVICRMNKDGSNKIKLNTDQSGNLNIIGEWIFYENQDCNYEIYKMSFDGDYNQPIY